MRRSRFSEEQFGAILREQEAGVATAEIYRKHGVSSATYDALKTKDGGLDVWQARRLKALEDENARLKKLLGEVTLPPWAPSLSSRGRRRETDDEATEVYALIAGEGSQYGPRLTENTVAIEPPHRPDYHLTTDLAERAVRWMDTQQAIARDRPFLMYWAPGAAHGPFQVQREWPDRYRGRSDNGLDATRQRTFERQRNMGWILGAAGVRAARIAGGRERRERCASMKEKQRVPAPPSGRSPGQQPSGPLAPELDHHQGPNRRSLPPTAPGIRGLRGEHALHPLLVALLALGLVARPLVDLGLLPRGAMAVAMLLTILAGLLGLAREGQRIRSVLVGTCLAAMVLQGLALGVAGRGTDLGAMLGAMLSFGLLAFAVLRQTLAPGRVTLRRIEGAIAAYLLIGLIFAGAYELVGALAPGAFLRNGAPMATHALGGDFVFFSFVTLTTTGYGDMVPVHPVARSLALLEAMTGQLFLAVVLARLVSLEIADRGA